MLYNNNAKYINDINQTMKIKTFCSFISLFFCLIIIVLYIILRINNLKNKKKRTSNLAYNLNNEDEFISLNLNRNKIGLGNRFFFYLIIGNFLGSFFEGIFTKFFETTEDIKNNATCIFLAVTHIIFDIWNICWTTLITFLFYQTSKSHINQVIINENRLTKFGFIYSFISIFIIAIFPLFLKPKNFYGGADIYCSFIKSFKDNIFLTLLIFLIFANLIINIYFLYKSQNFYSKKLLLLRAQNNNREYIVVRNVKIILISFIFILALSRTLKGLNRIGISDSYNYDFPQFLAKFFLYSGTILYSLTGFFNFLICIYFFRGVFYCFKFYNNCVDDEKNQINIDSSLNSETEF
jgi:hypothetical protein